MTGATVQGSGVHVGAGSAGKSLEEIGHKLGLQIAREARAHLGIDGVRGAAAEIDGGYRERFVHRHDEVAGAQNAALVAQGPIERLSQGNADVLDRVVLVDVEIAIAAQGEVECAMTREQFQHVIEKADAGTNFVAAGTFDGQSDGNARLGGVAPQLRAALLRSRRGRGSALVRGSHQRASSPRKSARISAMAAAAFRICSRVPTVMRTQPRQPGSSLRSRTSTPAAFMRRPKSARRAPISTRTKLPRLGHRRTPAASSVTQNSSRAATTSPTYQSR